MIVDLDPNILLFSERELKIKITHEAETSERGQRNLSNPEIFLDRTQKSKSHSEIIDQLRPSDD